MIDIREPKYQWGQPVQTLVPLYNDGGFPDAEPDALLAELGAQGSIVQTGMHTDSNTPLYLVEFPDGKVIGCLEEELAPV